MRKLKITEKHETFGGKYWTVEVDGQPYRVASREHGSIWSDSVTKSTGPFWMLFAAGVIDPIDYPRLGQKPGEEPRDFCETHGRWYTRGSSCFRCEHEEQQA